MNTVPETPENQPLVEQLTKDLRANLKIADSALSKVREDAGSGGSAVLDEVSNSLRALRADISQVIEELDATTTDQRSTYLAEARRRLQAGRGVLDELWVRRSLARKDLGDQTEAILKSAENAWLAARNRLSDAQQDLERSVEDARRDLGDSLRNFNSALSEARAAFTRGISD